MNSALTSCARRGAGPPRLAVTHLSHPARSCGCRHAPGDAVERPPARGCDRPRPGRDPASIHPVPVAVSPVVGIPQVAPTPATARLPHPARSTLGALALSPQRYAAPGVGGGQWPSLAKLWQRERGWHDAARNLNLTSGAYGIPQALPAYKMASAGSDWRTNRFTQVRWGLAYIRDRYETPCAALRHSDVRGWY